MPDLEMPPGTRLLDHVAMPQVSSTLVRERLAKGQDVSDLVPGNVIREINLLKLYRDHQG